MIKKKIAGVLLAAASMMVFTGCGSDNQTKGSAGEKSADRILACSFRKLRWRNC